MLPGLSDHLAGDVNRMDRAEKPGESVGHSPDPAPDLQLLVLPRGNVTGLLNEAGNVLARQKKPLGVTAPEAPPGRYVERGVLLGPLIPEAFHLAVCRVVHC